MSDTGAFPNGYTCGDCGMFVGWNTGHICGGRRFVPEAVTIVAPTEERIAAALERIAAALEAGS